jgi:CHAT domain-containing protein/tetratricopeptide (TPR) repeat protein
MKSSQLVGFALLVVLGAGPADLRAAAESPDPAKEAWSLRERAIELRKRGKLAESIAALERAVTLGEGASRLQRKRLADIHLDLARAYADRSQDPMRNVYDIAVRSASHFERALALWQNERGISEIEQAVARTNLANVYNRVGRHDEALPLFASAMPHLERRFGKDSAQVASALGGVGLASHLVHRFEDSERAYRRAIEIYRARPQHRRDVVVALDMLAQMYWSSDSYVRAVEALEESIETAQAAFGNDSPSLISPLQTLAAVRNYQTQFWRVNEIYDRIAAICAAHPRAGAICEDGPRRPDVLGSLAYDSRNNREAIRHYRQWIDSVASVDWNADRRIGVFQMISMRLAALYESLGEYRNAAVIRERMVEVYSRHPTLAATVPLEQLRLAHDYERAGDSARADELYRLVIPTLEVQVRHPQQARTGDQPPGDCREQMALDLADYYVRHGQRDRARKLLSDECAKVSHEISESEYATRLLLRARFLDRAGFRDDALGLYERVLPLFEQIIGAETPAVAGVLLALSRGALGGGHVTKGISLLDRAIRIYRSTLPLIESRSAEDERRAAVDLYSGSLDLAVSIDRDIAPGEPAALALAAQAVLERKGRLLQSSRAAFAALRERKSGAAAQALDDLARVRAERAALELPGVLSRGKSPDASRVQALRTREQRLERLAANLIPSFQPDSEPITAEQVCQVLARKQAVVEMITYRPYDPANNVWRASRVAGYVFRWDGSVTSVDLGPSKALASAVAAFREELSSASVQSRDGARALYQLLMTPLEASLIDVETVFFSPDGDVSLAPLGALVDPSDRYLLERYDVRYLTAGRDILRPVRDASTRPAILFGNPDYGIRRPTTASSHGGGGEDFHFTPLLATESEVAGVAKILEGATVYLRDRATEAQVKQIHGPRILHIATHGYFIPNVRGIEDELAGATMGIPDDPLLRAGLAMACANAPCNSKDDGVLTALEATTLDLDGTELVVLSACNTGVGDAAANDSVYGLRRAFLLAGARQQMVSLWPIQEGPANDFVMAFYERMQTMKVTPSEALRAVQREWARQGSRQHPNYWASFVLSGR